MLFKGYSKLWTDLVHKSNERVRVSRVVFVLIRIKEVSFFGLVDEESSRVASNHILLSFKSSHLDVKQVSSGSSVHWDGVEV